MTDAMSPWSHDDHSEVAWLRDLSRGPELRAWLSDRRHRYDEQSQTWEPVRQGLLGAARSLLPETLSSPTWTVNHRVFQWRWAPSADYPVLWMREAQVERPVLDLTSLTATGFVRLGDTAISPDGRALAFTVDTTGGEAYELRVLSLDALPDLAQTTVAARVYYGLLWSHDSRHLLSLVHDPADRPSQLWQHDVLAGTSELLYEESDERFHLALRPSGDPNFAVLRAASRLTAEEWLIDLDSMHSLSTTRGRTEGVDYTVEPVVVGGQPKLVQVRESPSGYRVTLEARESDHQERVLLHEAPTRRPRELLGVGASLLVLGREGGVPTVWLLDLHTAREPAAVLHADPGTSLAFSAYDCPAGSVCLERTSWTEPSWWEALDLRSGAIQRVFSSGQPVNDLVVETRIIPARDGVGIPVTILRSPSTPLDGTAPCLLYGYGAWETVIEPEFDPIRIALVRQGVVYAHAHIRGGGELGRDWWRQGRMQDKVTTFHDFVDATRGLAADLVHPDRIVAHGLSAGGLLMGAVNAIAPTAYAGILAEGPFVDPVTTMSDPSQPLVIVERDEWGDPRREPDRAWMTDWAPLGNLPPSEDQPPLLITSAVNDPRVSVWEPARWVAKLEQQGAADRVLFRVDLGARGHWAPPGRWQHVEFVSDLMSWVAQMMRLAGASLQDPKN